MRRLRHVVGMIALLVSCTNNVVVPPLLVDAECRTDCGDVGAMDSDGGGETADTGQGCELICTDVEVDSVWESTPFENCAYASAQVWNDQIIAMGGGRIIGLDPKDGAELWRFEVPKGDGQFATIIATPVVVGDLLVGEYHTTEEGEFAREDHFVFVLDLDTHELATNFERWNVTGTFDANDGEVVPFRSENALGRAHLLHMMPAGSTRGRVLVTYGNARDIQPWHGFAFELDLDVWETSGPDAAVTGSLITTPEADCGLDGVSGSRERICGGGLWSPSGSLLIERGDTYEIILATGNGQLDLNRNDFANTLLKVGPGLAFEKGCDENACADFDSDAPARACVESCENVFVPRDDVGDPFPVAESGVCDGDGMFECWQKLDYIGGSTPVRFVLESGTEVLAYPTKDGSVYLVDANHLGTLYDRAQLVDICGTADDACRWTWAGMIVTQPAVPTVTQRPTLLVPTFMPDETHPAGVVALAIDESSGTPKFERLWSVPDFDSPAAKQRFREHPSRIELQRVSDDLEIAWIVEALRRGKSRLLGIDVATGDVLAEVTTNGSGMRFTKPLLVGDMLYVNHCVSDSTGTIEALSVRVERE